ncbi:unknown protein [Parachlamydia acanthamoebae UV-7]|uniref:Uncharacterized protein n=4 Tax=Parachlamydia acanthamoebae TaxID=83552 RepID=F8L0M9_PARAV|nr:unknown protein [Parachlamydia acanthamoebae UV-7]
MSANLGCMNLIKMKMDNAEFVKLYCKIGLLNGFTKAFGCLWKESNECIVMLELQKSNYGNYYELNVKIFVHGAFGDIHRKSKDLKKDVGHVFTRSPSIYGEALDLDTPIDLEIRTQK